LISLERFTKYRKFISDTAEQTIHYNEYRNFPDGKHLVKRRKGKALADEWCAVIEVMVS